MDCVEWREVCGWVGLVRRTGRTSGWRVCFWEDSIEPMYANTILDHERSSSAS